MQLLAVGAMLHVLAAMVGGVDSELCDKRGLL